MVKEEEFRCGVDPEEIKLHFLTFLLIEMLPVLVARIGEAFSGCAKMGKDTLQMKQQM